MKRLIKNNDFKEQMINDEEKLIPLQELSEADVRHDRCPNCKNKDLTKDDGFKYCTMCNTIYKILDGKGYIIN